MQTSFNAGMAHSSQEAPDALDIASLERRLTGLLKLVEITRRLAAETDLNRILQVVTDCACQALDCERASLFLYDAQRNQLYTQVVTELEISEIRSSLDAGITGWVGRHRRIANVPNPGDDDRWNSSIDLKTGFITRNILAVPLISAHDDQLLGVLEVLNRHDRAFDSEDERLFQAFATHAAVALERAELLAQVRKVHELEGSIDVARRIQSGFLPQELPQIEGYELAAWWQPALGVGGDYYDMIPLPDGRLALVIADVSGHGPGPSLIMASARAMLHVLARTYSDPGRMLTLLSDTISPDLTLGRFITILLAALDIQAHTLTFTNAGHAPVLHLQRRTQQVRVLESTGFPIGVALSTYHAHKTPVLLEPGDLIVFATDGAIELRNEEGEMFGRDRLVRFILRHQTSPADDLLALLREEIKSFSGGKHPDDDITLFVLERKQPSA